MAGVLAGGQGAALSDSSAGDHWELTELMRQTAHVTVPRHRRSRPGLIFHTRPLPADELTEHEGIPVTTVARTIFDLAATGSEARLRHAIAIAEARVMADSPSLIDLLARYPGHAGTARLRSALEVAATEVGAAHRELELRFAEFLDEYELPTPERNVAIEAHGRTYIVDCLWRRADLVVELDSRRHHGDWEAAESDRARDAALLAIGLRTLRVTWRRLHRERPRLAADLRAALRIHLHRP
jgi:hypothetical protein